MKFFYESEEISEGVFKYRVHRKIVEGMKTFMENYDYVIKRDRDDLAAIVNDPKVRYFMDIVKETDSDAEEYIHISVARESKKLERDPESFDWGEDEVAEFLFDLIGEAFERKLLDEFGGDLPHSDRNMWHVIEDVLLMEYGMEYIVDLEPEYEIFS